MPNKHALLTTDWSSVVNRDLCIYNIINIINNFAYVQYDSCIH